MKKKIIYISIIPLVILAAFMATAFFQNKNFRYHQHREDKNVSVCEHGEEVFCTHLPIINISTNGQKIPGEAILDAEKKVIGYETSENGESTIVTDVSIIDQEGNNHQYDNPVVEENAMIRYRGNSSRLFDKKGYKILFVDKDGNDKNVEVMGMSKHNEWALNGPFLDKTLMRNYMWMNISAEVMGYAPNVRFCEAFLDGKYQGIYLMMETIDIDEGRVDITKYKEGQRGFGYILKLDRKEDTIENLDHFTSYTFQTEYETSLSIEHPGKSKLTEEVKQIVENDISKFEKALFSYDYSDDRLGYEQYIDVDSFVDYYILQEFLCVNDMCSRSTYLYKDVRGKLTMGPVWDYNNALDNFIADILNFDGSEIYFVDRTWYKMLFRDKAFVDKVVKRYHQLRKSFLSEEYLLDYIDDTIVYLGDGIERNYSVWGYSFDPYKLSSEQRLRPMERNPADYNAAINQMKKFIVTRGKWLDKHIETLYQYCHESKNKQFIQ